VAKRRAVRKKPELPRAHKPLSEWGDPPAGSYSNPLRSDKPMAVSDILEIVEAAGSTLRAMRLRITQLEVENQRLQNLVDKASYH
jgi:hypothetical protein